MQHMPKLLKKLITNPKNGSRYCEEVRQFCLGLHYHSPAGYEFVRRELLNELPNVSTLRGWYSGVDAKPGICPEAILTIEQKVANMQAKQKKLLLNLVMDEMAIRKKTHLSGGVIHGFVDYGSEEGPPSKSVLASEALVFSVTAINDNWKVPVAYFFSANCNAEEKKSFTHKIISAIESTGAICVAFTFDGAKANLKCAELLGATLKETDMNTSFRKPGSDETMHIVMDPSHMIKLVRNTYANQGILYDFKGREIKFDYINQLEQYQNKIGLRLANKLTKAHVKFQKKQNENEVRCSNSEHERCRCLGILKR